MDAVLKKLNLLFLPLLCAALLAALPSEAWGATTTHAISTASTSNATSYASGSFTPAAGDLLIATVTASGTIAAGTMTDTQALGFTRVATALKNTSADTIYVFVALHFAAASSMTVTFNCTGDSATGAVIQIVRVSGMSRRGIGAIRQFAVQANQAAGGTPAPAFTAAALTGNPTIGVVGNSTSPATLTAPTGWTELDDTGYATPTTGAEYVTRNSGFTGTTITWGSTSASAFGDIILELDASAIGTALHVQDCVSSGATAITASCPLTATDANDAIFCGLEYDSTSTLSSFTDSGSQAYSSAYSILVNGNTIFTQRYKEGGASGITSVTATFNVSSHGMLICSVFAGIATSSALDQQASSGTFAASWTSGSTPTTSQADEVLIGQSFCFSTTNCGYTPGSGYKASGHIGNNGIGSDSFLESQIVSATGAYAATGSVSTGSGNGGIATYKVAAAGGAPPCKTFIALLGAGCN